jgi:FkbM family methyltransferase
VNLRASVRQAGQAAGFGPLIERIGTDYWPSRMMRRERRDNRHAIVSLAAALEADSDVIDVGANRGAFLDAMRRLAPDGQAIACEPIPDLAAALRSRHAGSPAVDVHECAVAEEPGTATFYWLPTAAAQSGLRRTADSAAEPREIEVRLATLDELVPKDFDARVLKIDVEGAELGVLRGGRETIHRCKPLILLEHGSAAAAFGATHEEVYDELAEAGLRVFDMDGGGPYSRADFTLRASTDRWNWLAR